MAWIRPRPPASRAESSHQCPFGHLTFVAIALSNRRAFLLQACVVAEGFACAGENAPEQLRRSTSGHKVTFSHSDIGCHHGNPSAQLSVLSNAPRCWHVTEHALDRFPWLLPTGLSRNSSDPTRGARCARRTPPFRRGTQSTAKHPFPHVAYETPERRLGVSRGEGHPTCK